jgi:pyruvate,water dikinase
MPQDIEFAVQRGMVYLLQARPITRIGFAGEAGEWTNADFRDGGVSSTVCSPLMWSLYEHVWNRSLKETLRELKLFKSDFEASRCYFERPYWNLGAVKECLATLPGYRERDFDEDLSVQINYDGHGNATPFSLRNVLRALPTLWAVPQFLKKQMAAAQQLLEISQDEYLRPFRPERQEAEHSFAELIETRYLPAECTYFRTIFAASLAKLDFLGAYPEADYIGLVSGLPPLRHLAPVRAVQSMTIRTPAAISSLIDQFSYHYRRGLDVIQPRWDEDREFVLQLLTDLPTPLDTSTDTAPQQQYEAARHDMLRRLPRRKHRRFVAKLQRLRTMLWLREELRDVSSFLYHRIRQYALAIGEQRELADGVFFQTFQEIIHDDRRQLENRRQTYYRYRNFHAPNEIGTRFQFDGHVPSGELRGIAASPGTATGRAYVCHSVEDASHMPPGSILVCPCTDPGWTPVLGRAAGVITETGGLLSHAAILCREYGIPAVLGIPHATQRIAHHCQIMLYGSIGHAAILSPEGGHS